MQADSNCFKRALYIAVLILLLSNLMRPDSIWALDAGNARLLTQPAVSGKQIAFVYANRVWLMDQGGEPRKVVDEHAPALVGTFLLNTATAHPCFSPDGSLIAYSAFRDGNLDVYVCPTSGGEPIRLTWHPSRDQVQGFSPDGKAVIFTSSRDQPLKVGHFGDHARAYSVSVDGGFPTPLPLPSVYRMAWSPDGRRIAYNPLPDAFSMWKNYRGGAISEIWIYDTADRNTIKTPQPPGGCNDFNPMWLGKKLFFLSDREGQFNLFSYDIETGRIKQHTHYGDFPILTGSAGPGKIIYEQAGYLYLFDALTEESVRLVIALSAPLPETRTRFVKASQKIRNGQVAASGGRAVFEIAGEIAVVPSGTGAVRHITRTPGVCERFPAWSPDGSRIAYFSDESGEYQLFVHDFETNKIIQKYELKGAGYYESPVWSPDGQKISYTDNSMSLYWMDLDSGRAIKIASEMVYGPDKTIDCSWSPDSNWIAYTLKTAANLCRVHIYSLSENKSFPVTSSLGDASCPVFDRSGSYLYFLGSTDAGPVRQWFDQSVEEMQTSARIYAAVPGKSTPAPMARASADYGRKDRAEVDPDGLESRNVILPLPAAGYRRLAAGPPGSVLYLKGQGPSDLCLFDLAQGREETVLGQVEDYWVSADGNHVLYRSQNEYGLIPSDSQARPGQGRLDMDRLSVRVEPRALWGQIFREAWRINRDFFYDPGMYGLDWEAIQKKYEAFLPYLTSDEDLYRILMWMGSEMAVGHHYVGRSFGHAPDSTARCGLLGADYEIQNGRYRFSRIYGHLTWSPNLRAPLGVPGNLVLESEYLLAVNGRNLTDKDNIYEFLQNTAGQTIELTVGPNPAGRNARIVPVTPLADETDLRLEHWIHSNIDKVNRASKGRVAYVYLPDTAKRGHDFFRRYFFPQVDKDAIIVDERFNGGGQNANYYLEILGRQEVCWFATRHGADIKVPQAGILGPKAVLINELSGSGGDLFPWAFRKFGLGKLIGKRTWGGLVGVLTYPFLMDGGYISAPDFAAFNSTGWVAENVGVSPDIQVEQWPLECLDGKDPQLEKAIEVIMEELEGAGAKPERPAYPRPDTAK